ncbi:MAG: hypothetical protein U1E28_07265 [Beijerinckiaceae bacterium]
MSAPPIHRGVNAVDPRNAAPIDLFRPKKIDAPPLRETLSKVFSGADLERKIAEYEALIAKAGERPPAPLGQRLEDHPDPYYGLGTHPDIIDIMWKLDKSLPRSCRYVFWGKPALVHPGTGIVFCVAFGTIGFVMRLPPDVLAAAPEELAHVADRIGGPHLKHHDISGAGPEWRFVSYAAPREEWARAAYDYAGLAG